MWWQDIRLVAAFGFTLIIRLAVETDPVFYISHLYKSYAY
jgi:hypothetical protein